MGRRWVWVMLVGLSVAVVGARQAPDGPPAFVEVYQAGDGGYHTFRIPSLLAARNGTLLAFAEGRKAGAGDAGDIDLVLKRSRDDGRTWSALQVIGDNGPNTFGNPCPVLDRESGTIWLLTTQNRGTDREKDIIAGSSEGSRTVWLMKSTDHGETWSAPVDITASVKRSNWTWYATGPGIGIRTRAGRLVIPANHAEAGTGIHRSHLVYSDDGGRTWTIGGISDPGTNESQVVELSDGRLLLNMRNHPPKASNHRMVAFSTDGGKTLTPARPDVALIEPPAQASLIALPSGRRRSFAFANPASTKRERLTVRISQDDGATWPTARVIHEGPAAYSSMAALRGGGFGVLFERGDTSPYERITFARLDYASFKQSRSLAALEVAGGAAGDSDTRDDLRRMDTNSPIAKELTRQSVRWRAAVLRKDRDALARWEWPEGQPLMARELRRPESDMATALWNERSKASVSATQFFRRTDGTTHIVVFQADVLTTAQRAALDDTTRYAYTCWMPRRADLPSTRTALQKVDDWRGVLCLSWVEDGETWRLDYSFGYPDEGDEAPK